MRQADEANRRLLQAQQQDAAAQIAVARQLEWQQGQAYRDWARTPFWTGERWITQDSSLEWDG